MKILFQLFATAALIICPVFSAFAAPGDLDATFGTNGIVTTAIPNIALSEANDVMIQPDGKIIVAAQTVAASGQDMVLVRYNPNGSLDTTFSEDGIVRSPFSNEFDLSRAVALQPDGKILLVGSVGNNPARFAVLRYNADGTPDASFDGDGVVTTTILQSASAQAVSVQADGKILVAGNTVNNQNQDFFTVIRYNSNGAVDTAFGADGLVFDSFGSIDLLSDLTLQADGKILVVGTGDVAAATPVLAMIRLLPNGSFDASFEADGRVALQIPLFQEARAVDLQADGKIVIGGLLDDYLAVFRFTANGMLDASFDGDGVATANFNDFSQSLDVKVQTDGKIVAGGSAYSSNLDFAVARFLPDGTLDSNFGAAGKVVTTLSTDDDTINRIAIQADGKIVGAGVSGLFSEKKITVARYIGSAAVPRTKFDFDGDDKADVAVTRTDAGNTLNWYILNSSNNTLTAVRFGVGSDVLATADYDGDGKFDFGVYRAGTWYLLRSQAGFISIAFGAATDKPLPADYDGDGKADIAVFRPSNGGWYRLNSSNGQFVGFNFGQEGDAPLVGDFDGDGKTDATVFRLSNGTWYRLNSGNGAFVSVQFGATGDVPTLGDFDGDGKTDISVFRSANGNWYRLNSSNNQFVATQWGAAGDIPVAADYDGDGKTDLAVFRGGNWYLLRSNSGYTTIQWGIAGDAPLPAQQ